MWAIDCAWTSNPGQGAKVQAVSWDFIPGVVNKTGSDSVVVAGGIVSTWAEFQAVAAGQVTVRATYEYRDGTITAMWVVYLFVEE